jgi:NADPH2:quinone reductase
MKPEPPFQLGVDFAGVVREAAEDAGFAPGDRVACCLPYGGGADLVSVHPEGVFPLPQTLGFEQAAALPMNYLTAQFALHTRAGLREGETVLVHGAAGGVGTASLQVAKGYGARTIAVVSTQAKADFVAGVGADHTVLVDGFLDRVKEITEGKGVDVVVDVVGGDLVTDSLRSLGSLGRLLVVGFTGGAIPQVKVNRLLLNNIDVRGVGWGAYAMVRPGYMRGQWDALLPMVESGVVAPPVGTTYPVEEVARALTDLEDRAVLGKTVLTFR